MKLQHASVRGVAGTLHPQPDNMCGCFLAIQLPCRASIPPYVGAAAVCKRWYLTLCHAPPPNAAQPQSRTQATTQLAPHTTVCTHHCSHRASLHRAARLASTQRQCNATQLIFTYSVTTRMHASVLMQPPNPTCSQASQPANQPAPIHNQFIHTLQQTCKKGSQLRSLLFVAPHGAFSPLTS